MKGKRRQSGITLIEMTVVIVIVATLVSLSLPSIRTLFSSVAGSGSAKALINASMATARAIAAKEQRYAGIRFQEDLEGNQYMIFIVNEEPGKMGNLTVGYRVVDGSKPLKLPDNVGVMDLMVGYVSLVQAHLDDMVLVNMIQSTDLINHAYPGQSVLINQNKNIIDTTCFSIIFSPSGRMVKNKVRTRNRDGKSKPVNINDSDGDVFNSPVNIEEANIGMFIQDDYSTLGFYEEFSRDNFVIYDKTEFANIITASERYTYLTGLDVIHINPYTGTMITD